MARHPLPQKLTNDAIVEVVLELRFETAAVPEVFFGRLAECADWVDFDQRRLPTADIPQPMRLSDPNLRYQPVFELNEPNGSRKIRVGPQSISYHLTAPYVGWNKFRPELISLLDEVFSKISELTVQRIGLRYVNALGNELHGINGLSDLNMSVSVDGVQILNSTNFNYTEEMNANTKSTIRVATKDLVQGELPNGAMVVIDVDIFTADAFESKDKDEVIEWVDQAHEIEKEQFFKLLTVNTINELREE